MDMPSVHRIRIKRQTNCKLLKTPARLEFFENPTIETLNNEDGNANDDRSEKLHLRFTLYPFVQVIRFTLHFVNRAKGLLEPAHSCKGQ